MEIREIGFCCGNTHSTILDRAVQNQCVATLDRKVLVDRPLFTRHQPNVDTSLNASTSPKPVLHTSRPSTEIAT